MMPIWPLSCTVLVMCVCVCVGDAQYRYGNGSTKGGERKGGKASFKWHSLLTKS